MKLHYIFLALISLLIFGCQTTDSTQRIDDGTLSQFVNPFIGTGGHGHTYPGATAPFGMVQLSPDTRLEDWDGCGGYHFTDKVIYGFSHTHLSGTGVSDNGDILFMPQPTSKLDAISKVNFNNGSNGQPGYSSPFQKSSEKASAGFYQVHLDESDCKVELTATERAGFHQYTFSNRDENSVGTVLLDLTHRDKVLGSGLKINSLSEIEGYRISTAWASNQKVYFVAQFSEPILGYELDSFRVDIKPQLFENEHIKAAFHFKLPSTGVVKVKVGISAVDIEGARKNLQKEISDWDFATVKKQTQDKWEKQLSKIEVDALTNDDKTIFYTALYHTSIVPNIFTDVDNRYRGHDDKIHTATDHQQYTVFSLWDTYRAAHPLYTITEQERTNDFINSFLKIYENDGRLPIWELWNNRTNCMIGYHAVSVIADAYEKGIRGYDAEKALEAMIDFAEEDEFGKLDYIRDGFLSSELDAESVSKTLEYAYNDWCIAMMALKMGKMDVYEKFIKRSQSWKNLFDPESKFFRAKNRNFWTPNFNPYEVNFHFTEANAWQYGYYVPHDVKGFVNFHGGKENFDKFLDAIFEAKTETSGRDQADITGLIGQYAHGNEPSHHIGYLYNYIEKPWKTQQIINRITNEMYKNEPHGYEGNEDCGQMSAWYVMSAMGLYAVAPSSPIYDIGTPSMKSAKINLENGKIFSIKANNLSKGNIYIQSATLNGKPIDSPKIDHGSIMNGGELVFEMGSSPNEKNFKGPLFPKGKRRKIPLIVPIPAVSEGERAFMNETTVRLNNPLKGAEIFYSTDGSEPTKKYERPIVVTADCLLKAKAKTSFGESRTIETKLYKIPQNRGITLATKYAPQYAAGGDKALIDFLKGGVDFRTGEWQGYEGIDLDATIDLGKNQMVNSVSINFLQDENAWIFMPEEVQFYASNDGKDFKIVSTLKNKIKWDDRGSIIEDFNVNFKQNTRYIRVVGKNQGDCPKSHKSAGGQCWIFADEISISVN